MHSLSLSAVPYMTKTPPVTKESNKTGQTQYKEGGKPGHSKYWETHMQDQYKILIALWEMLNTNTVL